MKIGPIEIKWVGFNEWKRDVRYWLKHPPEIIIGSFGPYTPSPKIWVIKQFRAKYGGSLKEAKEKVDFVMKEKE